jgi:hypothetical protein
MIEATRTVSTIFNNNSSATGVDGDKTSDDGQHINTCSRHQMNKKDTS